MQSANSDYRELSRAEWSIVRYIASYYVENRTHAYQRYSAAVSLSYHIYTLCTQNHYTTHTLCALPALLFAALALLQRLGEFLVRCICWGSDCVMPHVAANNTECDADRGFTHNA
jgi:uncharacterized membrane protein YfbV (UPF0208 family)